MVKYGLAYAVPMNVCDFTCLNSQGVIVLNSCYYTANQTEIIFILSY